MFVCSLLVIMILLTIERLILKHIRIEQVIHLSTAFLTCPLCCLSFDLRLLITPYFNNNDRQSHQPQHNEPTPLDHRKLQYTNITDI
jgi:hypothetical protein